MSVNHIQSTRLQPQARQATTNRHTARSARPEKPGIKRAKKLLLLAALLWTLVGWLMLALTHNYTPVAADQQTGMSAPTHLSSTSPQLPQSLPAK